MSKQLLFFVKDDNLNSDLGKESSDFQTRSCAYVNKGSYAIEITIEYVDDSSRLVDTH